MQGVVLPEGSVPDFMQRLRTPGRVCVCFYGPSIAQVSCSSASVQALALLIRFWLLYSTARPRIKSDGTSCDLLLVVLHGRMFIQSRIRDYYWLPTEDLMPWDANSSLEQPVSWRGPGSSA